jgi:hypothetical protein
MSKFKIGDRVRAISSVSDLEYLKGKEGTVCQINPDFKGCNISVNFGFSFMGGHNCDETCPNGFGRYGSDNEFELIDNKRNKIYMNIKEKFAMMMKGEPDKSFFKAGITNSDFSLTSEGTQIFLQYLLKKNGDAFKTEVVDGLLAEDK